MDGALKKIEELRQWFLDLRNLLDIDGKEVRAKELRLSMSASDFWDNQELAIKISQEAENLFSETKIWHNFGEELKDLTDICALADKEEKGEEPLDGLASDIEKKYQELFKRLADLEFYILFSDKHDHSNAFLSIHSGTGGVDAQDWTEMLQRMYLRFAEKKGFKAEILDTVYGNEAGIKSSEIRISGPLAYGYLKSENGVHRLLRNSPFNADGLRQTSFALVEVIPEIKEEEAPEIKEEDIRIDVYRSSGPGGQSVNTTDSAVRITHLASGLVAACQTERSQHQNKENAFKILRNKLFKKLMEEREEEERKLKGELKKAEWGKQIRSYFLYGNRLVKDHRSDFETSDVDSVLDGDLEAFMSAYLRIK